MRIYYFVQVVYKLYLYFVALFLQSAVAIDFTDFWQSGKTSNIREFDYDFDLHEILRIFFFRHLSLALFSIDSQYSFPLFRRGEKHKNRKGKATNVFLKRTVSHFKKMTVSYRQAYKLLFINFFQ